MPRFHYSSRGPTKQNINKPNILASGSYIKSCKFDWQNQKGAPNYYTIKSGTSMATPVVSGAIAMLLQQNEEMTNEDIKK